MKNLLKSLRLVFDAAPTTASFSFLVVIIASLIPSVMALLSARVINALAFVKESSDFLSQKDKIFVNIIAWLVLLFVSNALSMLSAVLTERLSDKLVDKINLALIEKTSSLKDLYNFENPDFHSDVHVLRTQAMTRPVNLVANLTLNIKNLTVLLSMLWVLGSISLSVPLILLICLIPDFFVQRKLNNAGWLDGLKNDIHQRRADYFVQLMLDCTTIKETLWLNLGSYARTNYLKSRARVTAQNALIRRKRVFYSFPTMILNTLGNIVVFLIIVRGIYTGLYSIGTLALFLQVFFQVHIYLSDLVTFGGYLKTILLYFDKFFSFMNWKNHIHLAETCLESGKFENGDKEKPYLEFKNVSFCYPGAKIPALENVSFIINEGESVALVGANGAGKSTIIKLIMRFYEPTSGNIFYKGSPIQNIEIDSWRSMISCVFQDFAKYAVPLHEAVSIPKSERHERIVSVLKDVEYTGSFENSLLGKEFGGTDLSGGQWQKIAIARALYHNAPLLILDEPTASIDPISEARLFRQFYRLCERHTSIIVTHRLASAVDATKIIVLNKAHIAQIGTHNELVNNSGIYKTMFFAQAEKYQNKKYFQNEFSN